MVDTLDESGMKTSSLGKGGSAWFLDLIDGEIFNERVSADERADSSPLVVANSGTFSV